MIGSLLTNHGFYFCRDAANACRRPSGIYNSLVIPSGFHNLGISNKTSFSYPQTFFLSVGISNKTSFPYPQTFIVWVSATKQASHTHKLFTLRRKKGTEKPVPIFYAHAKAEEGHRGACSYLLCPREGGRRAQRSLLLSPVPTLRRKKGTEKLAPVTCAHVEAEEGHRRSSSSRWQACVNNASTILLLHRTLLLQQHKTDFRQ